MKKILIIAFLALTACSTTNVPETNSNLNQSWCDKCSVDASYSWCKFLKSCNNFETDEVITPAEPSEQIQEQRDDSMKGNKVRVKATAYELLCERDPTSPLCTTEQ